MAPTTAHKHQWAVAAKAARSHEREATRFSLGDAI